MAIGLPACCGESVTRTAVIYRIIHNTSLSISIFFGKQPFPQNKFSKSRFRTNFR